jgi:hypothetical protein
MTHTLILLIFNWLDDDYYSRVIDNSQEKNTLKSSPFSPAPIPAVSSSGSSNANQPGFGQNFAWKLNSSVSGMREVIRADAA